MKKQIVITIAAVLSLAPALALAYTQPDLTAPQIARAGANTINIPAALVTPQSISKKHVVVAGTGTPGTRFAAKAVGVPAALITPEAPAHGVFYVTTARKSESNPFLQGVRFVARFF